MREIAASLVLIAVIVFSLCVSVGASAPREAASANDLTAQGSNVYSNVFMIYMCADNSLSSSADTDLQEMVAAGGSDASVAIVVLLDKPGSTDDGIYEVTAAGPVRVWMPLGELNSADPGSLALFLNHVRTNYQASRYVLDIWNHGNGFQVLQGICYDDNPGVHMSIPDLNGALAASGMHFGLIAFDACLMDMVEVAYEIHDAGDVMLASEENVPADGLPYTPILTWLKANPQGTSAALGSSMVNAYSSAYSSTSDVTMAAIDLARVPALAVALDGLSDTVLPNIGTLHAPVRTAISNTERHPWSMTSRDYGDIVDFTAKLDAQVTDADVRASTAAVRAAATSAVLAEAHHGSHVQDAHGLSVLLAWNRYYSDYAPLRFSTDTSWDELALALTKQATALPPVSLALGPPAVQQKVTLSGTLVTASGVGIEGQIVQGQRLEGTSWTDVSGRMGATSTGGAYSISWSESSPTTATYRVHYAGSTTYLGSDSAGTTVTVQAFPTVFSSLTVVPLSPIVSRDFVVSGTVRTASGAAVVSETVQLQRWDGSVWTDLGKSGVTDLGGAFSITTRETAGGTFRYRVHFPGRGLLMAGDSAALEITVQKLATQLTIASSSPAPLVGTEFALSGGLTVDGWGLSGKTVRFWSSTDSGATWTEMGKTANTGAPYGTYALTLTESVGGSKMYKVTFDGDGQYAASASPALTVRINRPPDLSKAYASQAVVQATTKHSFVSEWVKGVTDPDGNTLTITITRITSDEPTATDQQSGGAKYAPDAGITGANSAIVRAERSSGGDGRVYAVSFNASDGLGGTAQGVVKISVPLKSGSRAAIDSGQRYDATQLN